MGMLVACLNLVLLYLSSALAIYFVIRLLGVNLADHVLGALGILLALPFPRLLKYPMLWSVRILPLTATLLLASGVISWQFSPSQEWTFVGLKDGDKIKQDIWLEGKHPDNVQGDIWVIQQQHKNGKYFPSAKSLDTTSCAVALVPRDGTTFGFPIRIGEANQKGERFTLMLAVANSTASDTLIKTLNTWCKQQSYPGLSELPSGLDTKHKVTVQRLSEP